MNPVLRVLTAQLAKPSGWLAEPMARLLNRGNRVIVMHTLGALDATPGEKVLEIGFGGGLAFRILAEHEPNAYLYGLELSGEMVERAGRHLAGIAQCAMGSVSEMPYDDDSMDAVYGTNVLYFWPNLAAGLAEVRRVLKTNGRLIMGIRPPETLRKLRFDEAGYRVWTASAYEEAFRAAGLVEVQSRRMPDPYGGTNLITARG